MTLDERGRSAAAALGTEVSRVGVPAPTGVVRRATRRRQITAAMAALVLIGTVCAGLAAAARESDRSPAIESIEPPRQGWSRINKAAAGLPGGSRFLAAASDDSTAVLAGATVEDFSTAEIWWSSDGLRWQAAVHPSTVGQVDAIAIEDGTGLAAVGHGMGRTTAVWRTEDGGRTWDPIVSQTVPPAISTLVRYDDWWVAAGALADGPDGLWVSADGTSWEQVLDEDVVGGLTITRAADGSLVAHAGTTAWVTDDPSRWGDPITLHPPANLVPSDIASTGSVAIGTSTRLADRRRVLAPLNGLYAWQIDAGFIRRFPDARPVGGERFGSVEVVTGADGQSRPTAWTRLAPEADWQPMPRAIRGSAAGDLDLSVALGDSVVAVSAAPTLDSIFIFDATPGATTTGPSADEAREAEAFEAEFRIGSVEIGTLQWALNEAQLNGIAEPDPNRAWFGNLTLGEVEPYLFPLVRQNVDTLDPADHGVATIESIPVAVAVYRSEPGTFDSPGGQPVPQHTLMVVEAPANGTKSTSIADFDDIDGLLTLLQQG
jgi:hypothetical protein